MAHDAGHAHSDAAMSRRRAFASIALPGTVFLAGCAGATRASAPEPARAERNFPDRLGASVMEPDGTRTFRNHALQDQDGRTVHFQDDLITGRVFAATFFYVHCKGICSDMTRNMAAVYDLLQPVMDNPVQMYSFSLAEDSPEDLRKYMQERGLYGRPGWRFLTGSRDSIKDIRWAFGFSDPDEEVDNNLNGHTGMARFGNHRLDKWSSCPALGDPAVTARSVLAVFPPNQRPHIAALDRSDAPAPKRIPGFTPQPPSMGSSG